MKKSIVVVVLAMLIVSACSSSEESSSTTTTSTPLQRVAEFEKCGTIECATIDVPLDYARS
jgi:ABC-type Fe3+-citrate transport system substrate-binding protein